jgi:SAM-dependent methyltransferase
LSSSGTSVHKGNPAALSPATIHLLRCPITSAPLAQDGAFLRSVAGNERYRINDRGVPLFASHFLSHDALSQQRHYEKIAKAYVTNLSYPHTREYMAHLDCVLLDVVDPNRLSTVAELCCGHGEALKLLRGKFEHAVGVDITESMLDIAVAHHAAENVTFIQGDATRLPLASDAFGSLFMLGGIHISTTGRHCFARFIAFSSPGDVSMFAGHWRAIWWLIYQVAPALDHTTERPLVRDETGAVLERRGLFAANITRTVFWDFAYS